MTEPIDDQTAHVQTGGADTEPPTEPTTPAVPHNVYQLRNRASIVCKTGVTTHGVSSVHRNHRRMEWWSLIDPARTILTTYPDKETAEQAKADLDAKLMPEYNTWHRPAPRVKITTAPTPAPDATAPKLHPSLSRIIARRENDARLSKYAPRRPGQICENDVVWSIQLGAEVTITKAWDDRTVFDTERADGSGCIAELRHLIAPKLRGEPYPPKAELDALRREWLDTEAPCSYIEPYPWRGQQQA